MRIGEVLLLACLVTLGTVSFVDHRAASRRTLRRILRMKRRLQEEVCSLRQRQRALKNEAEALRNDPYYVERMAREQLGWQPIYTPTPAPPIDPAMPTTGTALAQRGPATTVPRRPRPPRSQASRGKTLLAALGYGSAAHFQRKMMGGRSATGTIDGTTAARARGLLAMLHRSGCASVKSFQARHGLDADGILGRRTERRLIEVLRVHHARRALSARRGVIAQGGRRESSRSGG